MILEITLCLGGTSFRISCNLYLRRGPGSLKEQCGFPVAVALVSVVDSVEEEGVRPDVGGEVAIADRGQQTVVQGAILVQWEAVVDVKYTSMSKTLILNICFILPCILNNVWVVIEAHDECQRQGEEEYQHFNVHIKA